MQEKSTSDPFNRTSYLIQKCGLRPFLDQSKLLQTYFGGSNKMLLKPLQKLFKLTQLISASGVWSEDETNAQ